jgi:hypothetical protein
MKPTRIIKSHAVTSAHVHGGPSAGPMPAAKPVVRVVRNGNLVESIEITCPCGETIIVDCMYDAATELAS